MKTYFWDGVSIASERPYWLTGDNVRYDVFAQELHIKTPDGNVVVKKGQTVKQADDGTITVED